MEPTLAAVTCMRWEQNDIAEWLAYHYLIGFNRFFIYCNDDDVGPALDSLRPSPVPAELVTFYHVEVQGLQRQCYYHFLDRHRSECDWAIFLDVDEMVVIRSGATLSSFLEDVPAEAGSVCLHWIQHGPNGIARRGKRSVLETYTRRSGYPDFHCKNFFRARRLPTLTVESLTHCPFWHCWGGSFGDVFLSVDILGRNMIDYFEHFPHQAAATLTPWASDHILRTAYISHFFMKSLEDAEFRILRGACRDFESQSSWSRHAQNGALAGIVASAEAVEDRYLANFSSQVVAPHLTQASITNGYGEIVQVPLHVGQHLQTYCPSGEVLLSGVFDGDNVVLRDVHMQSVSKPIEAAEQIRIAGGPPAWRYSFNIAAKINGLACYLNPSDGSGRLGISINAGEVETMVESPLFGLYSTLSPHVWMNTTGLVVREVSLLALDRPHISLDQVKIYRPE